MDKATKRASIVVMLDSVPTDQATGKAIAMLVLIVPTTQPLVVVAASTTQDLGSGGAYHFGRIGPK